jgi:hypothetical protein
LNAIVTAATSDPTFGSKLKSNAAAYSSLSGDATIAANLANSVPGPVQAGDFETLTLAPTSAPTASPTVIPTAKPTAAPTVIPTRAPTAPTRAPTAKKSATTTSTSGAGIFALVSILALMPGAFYFARSRALNKKAKKEAEDRSKMFAIYDLDGTAASNDQKSVGYIEAGSGGKNAATGTSSDTVTEAATSIGIQVQEVSDDGVFNDLASSSDSTNASPVPPIGTTASSTSFHPVVQAPMPTKAAK